MRKMVRYLFAAVLLLFSTGVFSQWYVKNNFPSPVPFDEIKPLTVGDKVPDIVFENVLNYKSKKARLSDFKGKLVILDIWSTWCTSCIAAFPKMEALQKEFGDKIQVLLVNPYPEKYDSEEKIKSTLERNRERTGYYPGLPMPIHDSVLNKYFPRLSVPHEVWINNEGIVMAVTSGVEMTRENVKKFVEGKNIDLPVKNDWGFDNKIPLLVNNNGGENSDYIYRSLFTGYKGEIGFEGGVRRNKNGYVIGYYELNKPLWQYVREAYMDLFLDISKHQIIIDVRDSGAFNWKFDPAHMYCYDLTIAPVELHSFDHKKFLREDLRHFFNISVIKEKRRLTCLVFSATNKLPLTKYDKPDFDLDQTSLKKYIRNMTVGEVLSILEHNMDKPAIVETQTRERIDIEFPKNFDLSDAKQLVNFLQQFGFKVTEEEREIYVVHISDK